MTIVTKADYLKRNRLKNNFVSCCRSRYERRDMESFCRHRPFTLPLMIELPARHRKRRCAKCQRNRSRVELRAFDAERVRVRRQSR